MKRTIIWLAVLCVLLVPLLSGCDRQTQIPRTEPGKPVLVFERTGGIAGFQDRLVIGYAGEYYLKSGQKELIGSLSVERAAQLREWYARLSLSTVRHEDNPGGPDNMVRQVTLAGLGKETATRTEQEQILKWAGDLLAELSTGS